MSVRERLLHNLDLKLLATALAVVLWLYVTAGKEAEVAVAVPVRVVNLSAGLALADQPPDRLDVRVVGPALALRRLHPDKMVVSLDMGQVKVGSVAFPSLDQLVPVPPGVRVVRVSPASIKLTVQTVNKQMSFQ